MIRKIAVGIVFSATTLLLPAQSRADGALATAEPNGTVAVEEVAYSPLQMLDGFGALFIGLSEPILFPIDQAQECKRKTGDQVHAGGCAILGLLASPFLACRDWLLGFGDIVTGGYYKLSRRAGVFDYFADPEPAPVASSPAPNPTVVEPPVDGSVPYPGYTRY